MAAARYTRKISCDWLFCYCYLKIYNDCRSHFKLKWFLWKPWKRRNQHRKEIFEFQEMFYFVFFSCVFSCVRQQNILIIRLGKTKQGIFKRSEVPPSKLVTPGDLKFDKKSPSNFLFRINFVQSGGQLCSFLEKYFDSDQKFIFSTSAKIGLACDIKSLFRKSVNKKLQMFTSIIPLSNLSITKIKILKFLH